MKTKLTTALLLTVLVSAQAQTPTPPPPPLANPPVADAPGPRVQGFAKGDRQGRDNRRDGRMRDDIGPQVGPEQSGPGRHDRMGRRGGPGGRNHGLTSLTTVTGTVGELTGNDEYILNGFTLSAGSAPAMAVQFPPHLGQQIQKAVKAGSSVSVTGFSDTRPDGETRFHMTSLTAGKTTITDAPPTAPPTPTAPVMTTTTGKITDYKLDRNGRVNGLVIGDNIIHIPPHIAYQLTNLAKKGTEITVQGYTRTLGEGQVQLQKANILRASILTINGQQYLVR